MRLLILFSMWSPDRSANSQSWLDYYTARLSSSFPNDDKFVVRNGNIETVAEDIISSIPKVIGTSDVPENMTIASDASGYQHALKACEGIIENYDAVCFFHTKGLSYPFDHMGHVRDEIDRSAFDRGRLVEALGGRDKVLVAIKGFLSPSVIANRQFQQLAARSGINHPVIHYAAAWTFYATSSAVVADMMRALPDEIKNNNLNSVGFDRFFFEAMVPSLLTALGATPTFLCGEQFDPQASRSVSFDALPSHNSAIVTSELRRMERMGNQYTQPATPYVLASMEQIRNIIIAFDQGYHN